MSNEKESTRRVQTTAALADFLGVSRWTVSRVLNGHPGVKEETRRRVEDAMVELGFRPNLMARGLRGSQTRLVGVCFQEVGSPILARKTMTLQSLLRDERYRAIIELTGGVSGLEEEAIRHFEGMRVDGLVLVGSTLPPDSPAVRRLRAEQLPVVAVDPVHPLPFATVSLDRHWAMRLKMEHLYSLGHRRFAFLGFEPHVPYGSTRLEGLKSEAQRLGLDPQRDYVHLLLEEENFQDYACGWRLAHDFLALDDPPSAVVALNDRIALGAIKHLREAGFRVPRDFSVVGFDNLDVTSYSHPTLTTIDQQVEVLMEHTVSQLLSLIEEGGEASTRTVRPVIRVRASSGPVRSSGDPA